MNSELHIPTDRLVMVLITCFELIPNLVVSATQQEDGLEDLTRLLAAAVSWKTRVETVPTDMSSSM